MGDGLGRGDGGQFLARLGAERAARRGQDDAPDLVRLIEIKNLEDRAVFGIDRQQRGARSLDLAHHQITGGHQAFLVGEGHCRPPPNRLKHRWQARRADDGRDHDIGRLVAGFGNGFRTGGSLD